MGNKPTIVVTAYGHDDVVDKIAVSLFEECKDADAHCSTINSLKLTGSSWVSAKMFSENGQRSLDVFVPLNFSFAIPKLDDKSIQKVLAMLVKTDPATITLAKALKGEKPEVQDAIFRNMSKRAAEMIKEDMRCMGPVRLKEVKACQEEIMEIICKLEQSGEIFTRAAEPDELVV